MGTTITVHHATEAGHPLGSLSLHLREDRVTVRGLIARRIEEEAARLAAERARRADWARRLGLRVTPEAEIDLEEAAARAWDAFERDRLRVIVGDRRAVSLDEEIPLERVPDVTVVATVPLIGG